MYDDVDEESRNMRLDNRARNVREYLAAHGESLAPHVRERLQLMVDERILRFQ
jgi:hypothetical protein